MYMTRPRVSFLCYRSTREKTRVETIGKNLAGANRLPCIGGMMNAPTKKKRGPRNAAAFKRAGQTKNEQRTVLKKHPIQHTSIVRSVRLGDRVVAVRPRRRRRGFRVVN